MAKNPRSVSQNASLNKVSPSLRSDLDQNPPNNYLGASLCREGSTNLLEGGAAKSL
ncbi:MAG: hypothetical protein ACK56F_29785 [bacterium]